MRVHPVTTELDGVVSVQMLAQFVGDPTDASDRQRILGFGDPQVNLAGLFTDPNAPSFQFSFPTTELYVGVTTQMSGYSARFMTALPVAPVYGEPDYKPAPLECLTPDPVHAATVWAATIQSRIAQLMVALRAEPSVLTSLPDTTV